MRRPAQTSIGQAAIWAAVALAFADSSIVVLALPDLLRQLDTSIGGVSLVITIYNVAVVVVTPVVIWLVRRAGPRTCLHAGLILFAAGSAGCALAGSLEALVALRAVQALGGAFLLASALPTLGVRRWSVAAAVGAALGPAIGGLLTEAFDWRAIFAFQAPVALAAVIAGWRAARGDPLETHAPRQGGPARERRTRPDLRGSRRCALPRRHPRDRGLGAVAGLGGAARLGAAGDDTRGRPALARRTGRERVRSGRDPRRGRPRERRAPAGAIGRVARARPRARGQRARHRRAPALGDRARGAIDRASGVVGRRAPSRPRARPRPGRAPPVLRHRHRVGSRERGRAPAWCSTLPSRRARSCSSGSTSHARSRPRRARRCPTSLRPSSRPETVTRARPPA